MINLVKILINIVIKYHDFPNSIVTNWYSFLSQNFDLHLIIFLILSNLFLVPSIYRQISKLKSKKQK